MSNEDFEQLLNFFRVLGNESRLKLLGMLANEACSVGELAHRLDLKEPTISHHLAKLKELDLVSVRTDGNTHYYSLNSKALERMNKALFTQQNIASLVKDDSGDAWERKVLQSFVDGETIKAIPAQQKKQTVIAKWLVEKFDPGRRYPESEVNEIIKRHHNDSAAWRRYMIEERLMARENGVYWRL